MLRSFPLLGISLLAYLGLLYAGSAAQPWYDSQLGTIILPSGASWAISAGEVFQLITLSLLFIEIVRSTRTDFRPLVNHSLDVLVFIAALTLFLSEPVFANSTFFSLLAMSLFDFVAGFIITTASARRDVAIGAGARHERASQG